MRKITVLALIIAAVAFAEVVIKDEGVQKGPVKYLNFVGSRVTVTRDGGTATVTVAACAGCDAGYALANDGGCAPQGPPCNPDNGLNADGGCACPSTPTPIALCVSLDGGELDGGWWCLKGDQTMLAGSAYALYPVGSPTTVSWPIFPSGTLETMTKLNDNDAGVTTWNQRFQTDGGQPLPSGAFTTCFLGADVMRTVTTAVPITCSGSGVNFENSDAGFKWLMAFPATCSTGDQVVCRAATPPVSCNSGTNSVYTAPRSQSLHCARFLPGDGGVNSGTVSACTTTQGATTVCTDTGTIQPKVGPSATGFWSCGGTYDTGIDRFGGWFRGCFMTEKYLSIAEQTRIGSRVLPSGVPAGMTFTRSTEKMCCDGNQRCSQVPNNVPCNIVPNGSAENQQSTNLAASSEIQQNSFIAGQNDDAGTTGIRNVTPNAATSPFGFTTSIAYTFENTRIWDGGVGPGAAQSSGIQASCNASGPNTTVRYQAWVAGPQLELCIENSTTPTTAHCEVCSPSGGQNSPTLCSVTGPVTPTNNSFYLGHLNSLHPAGQDIAWPTGTNWITGLECSRNSWANDYQFSSLGVTVTRAPDAHNSMTCAP